MITCFTFDVATNSNVINKHTVHERRHEYSRLLMPYTKVYEETKQFKTVTSEVRETTFSTSTSIFMIIAKRVLTSSSSLCCFMYRCVQGIVDTIDVEMGSPLRLTTSINNLRSSLLPRTYKPPFLFKMFLLITNMKGIFDMIAALIRDLLTQRR